MGFVGFVSGDGKTIATVVGAMVCLLLTGGIYLGIWRFLRTWTKRTQTPVDDKILAVIEYPLLLILMLGVLTLFFSFVPLPLSFREAGKSAFLTGMIVVAVVLAARLSLLFVEWLEERYEFARNLGAPLRPLLKVLFGIVGVGVVIASLIASGGVDRKVASFLLTWCVTSGLRIVLVVALFFIGLHGTRLLTGRLCRLLQGFFPSIERRKRAQTLSSIVQSVATTFLLVVSVILVLRELGVEIAPLLATAGIGGLALGFGAQNLVRDVISGFFILLEDQIRVGDVVRIGDKGGYVESVGLRIITLRDFDGSVHVIPNGTIGAVTNMTKGFSYYQMNIRVSYREDLDKVTVVLKEVGAEMRHDPEFAPDILEDLEVVGVDDFVDSTVVLKVQIKTQPVKQWRVGRELRWRIKKAFDAHGVELK